MMINRILGCLALITLATCSLGAGEAVRGVPDPAWDGLFQQTNGWIGADGNYSVPLSPNETLWLFSDTFVGEIKEGKRVNARMIHNSIALQSGTNRPVFYYGKTSDGRPDSFINPLHGATNGYFWLNHGLKTPQALYCFALQVLTVDTKSPFGFKLKDGWLIRVSNPEASPDEWRMTQTKVPFTKISGDESLIFGGAVLEEKGFAYIFGSESWKEKKRNAQTSLVMARVPVEKFGDFDQWRFHSNGEWRKDTKRLSPLFENLGSEFSISRLPSNGKYVAVYTEGISDRIVLRSAPALTGPWREAQLIYRCPDAGWSSKVFCYAAKAHPELPGAPDELLITYAANSWNFWDLFTDPRLYWPRFVRYQFPAGEN